MNRHRIQFLCLTVAIALAAHPAFAQFYGGGFYGGGFGNGFYGGNMAAFAPPHSVGGFYPSPYGSMYPGYMGGVGYGPGMYGYGPGMFAPPVVPQTPGLANSFANYPGFGWWPMSATDVKVTAVPTAAPQTPATSSFLSTYQQPNTRVATTPGVVHTGAEIKLVSPKTTGLSLNYSLNGTPYTMHPGYTQEFRNDRTWKLEFRRGGAGTELVTYTLKPGTYNFAVGTSGWELRQVIKGEPGDPPTPRPST